MPLLRIYEGGLEINMKTLYISDLDGTLLMPDALISDFTQRAIKLFAENGIDFTVATARTSATVKKMLEGCPVSTPAILMNGVYSYDLQKNEFTNVNCISDSAKELLLQAVSGTSGFVYSISEGKLSTYYERCDTDHSRTFRTEREEKYGKVFTKVDSFTDCKNIPIVYFSIAGLYEELSPLYDRLRSIGSVHLEFYRDVYNSDFFYLEGCAEGVSKYAAALLLREKGGYDRLIGFGDNLNDLSLFDACDECFAVSNAVDKVKERADGVIGANFEDGVVRYIAEREGLSLK